MVYVDICTQQRHARTVSSWSKSIYETLSKRISVTGDLCAFLSNMNKRLEEIKQAIIDENISYGEIVELQTMKDQIPDDEVVLKEWAGIVEQ